MNIIIYCQYVWGMGHLFRSLEIAGALVDHQVTLVAGGQDVDVDLPDHVTLLKLPVLYMDEQFTRLIPGDPKRSVADVQRERRDILTSLFEAHQPDLFIVELYPFGRTKFGFELEPLLESIRKGTYGRCRSVCSLRDILVEKKKQQAYEARVIDILDRFFDLLLVHSDAGLLPLEETFGSVSDIPIPICYTGFITRQANPGNGAAVRRKLGLDASEKLIVASAGGGRAGHDLLKPVLQACRSICTDYPLKLEVFTGPFMDDEEYDDLVALSGAGMNVRRFTRRFVDYLAAADLSISRAGYNTCMNLLATGIPALVYPYFQQQEQPLRVEKMKPFMPIGVLSEVDLQPERLTRHIHGMLLQTRPTGKPAIDLNGSKNTARILEEWVRGSSDWDRAGVSGPRKPA